MRTISIRVFAALLLAASACIDDDDASSAIVDMGEPDATPPDMGMPDLGPPDLGPPDTGITAETFALAGLSAPVTVRFDQYGIPSIQCSTDADCFTAQGYIHARYRFGQMDLRRRSVRGGLAEFAGAAAIESDVAALTFFANGMGLPIAQQLWDGATPETRAAITAYTRGVNEWIKDLRAQRNDARLTLEWDAYADRIAEWEELDSVACILALIESLTNQTGRELALGAAYAALPVPTAIDILGIRPANPSTILSVSTLNFPEVSVPALEAVQQELQPYRSLLSQARLPTRLGLGIAQESFGSNNWVVSPSQTADGRALMTNDPHLGMTNPSIWFLINVDSKSGGGSIHVAGASFAGLPSIILGQNEDIAWGATVAFFDMADVYLETLTADRSGVVFNGQDVPFVTRQFTIPVARGAPVTQTALYVPHHGPVVALDPVAGTALSIRWSGHRAQTDLNLLLGVSTATSVDSFREVLRRSASTIGQNYVVADREGDIGWFPYNDVPTRPWASALRPSWLPLPGDGSSEWGAASIGKEMLPQAKNPSAGFLATANNDMTGGSWDGDPTNDGRPMLQHFPADGYRHARIVERLTADATMHSLSTMQSILADVHSLIGEELAPAIVRMMGDPAAQLSPEGQAVVAALSGWNFQCPTGLQTSSPTSMPVDDAEVRAAAVGCTAFHAVYAGLIRGIFDDELNAAGVEGQQATTAAVVDSFLRPGRLLGSYWDDVSTVGVTETSTQTVAKVVDEAAAQLVRTLGADSNDWLWGRIHTLTLRADLFDAVGIPFFNNGPFANDGGLFTVDVANPVGAVRAEDFSHPSGPSMRFACALGGGSGVECTIELPGGQRHFRNDPNLQDLLLKYLANDSISLPFTPAQAEARTVQRLTLTAN